jgi:hypothetical protein
LLDEREDVRWGWRSVVVDVVTRPVLLVDGVSGGKRRRLDPARHRGARGCSLSSSAQPSKRPESTKSVSCSIPYYEAGRIRTEPVQGARCKVQGARCKVQGARCKVQVQGARCKCKGQPTNTLPVPLACLGSSSPRSDSDSYPTQHAPISESHEWASIQWQ